VIVRELLTSLGIDFDTKGADAAEKKIGSLKSALETVGTVLTFGGVFAGLKTVVGYASDAEQTMSKLRLNFQDNTQSVLDWADATAKSTGESKYALREMAGTFGSMLVPTMDFNREKAAEMSMTLTGLAEDLAAINNEKPEETMQRLFSGMTGSSEAVERLGINIKQLALQEFAQTKGITTKVQKMNVRQKAELIYAKILADTKDKVGAAAKESDSYAGRMLRLSAALRDAGTTLGQKLIPYASDFVGVLTRGVGVLGEWAGDTNKVIAAFTTLGTVLAAMAGRFLIANLPIIGFAAGLALITIAVNDLLTAFMDPKAKTAIGTFMEMLVGDKNWERLRQLPSTLGDVLFEMGLTPEQKKMRGIDNQTGNSIIAAGAGLLGVDYQKVLDAEKRDANNQAFNDLQRRRRIAGGLEAAPTTTMPTMVDYAAQGGVAPYLSPERQRAPAPLMLAPQITTIVQGNADASTVQSIEDRTRAVLAEERRRLYSTTRAPAGFENNELADEDHILSGAGGVP
jgi:hypothetical protein